jgi:hypothetical protein
VRRDFLQHRLGQAVPQMPAIPGLHRAGQRPPDRLAVCPGPVPAHDLNAGVPAQPRLRHISGAAGQDIDPLPGRGVDQHGRVLMAAAQREVVDAEHEGDAGLGQRKPQQQAQRGMSRDRDAQARQQPGAGAAR